MKILHEPDSLKHFLENIHHSKVTIVTAFAAQTEPVIETLLRNGNYLTLVAGTINYFTDPVFIEHCHELAGQKNSRLELFVDFRGQNSIHWKLYLVEPDVVVIGSPNLTVTGLSMQRDTAVHLQDKTLYQQYQTLVTALLQQGLVLSSVNDEAEFKSRLAAYKPKYLKQTLRRVRDDPPTPLDFQSWVAQEENLILPLFIWERLFTQVEKEEFEQEIEPAIHEEYEGAGSARRPSVAKVGVWYSESTEPPYEKDIVVLSMKDTGAYAYFDTMHRVIPGKRNRWWLCRVGKRSKPPFELTKPLKELFKKMAKNWNDQEKTYLDSKDLRELAKRLGNT